MINFRSQVPLILSETVFPLAAGQRLLTLLTFSLMSPGRRSVVTFQAMNTRLRRKIAYQMPSRALRRNESSNQAELFFFFSTLSSVCLELKSSLTADLQHQEFLIHRGRKREHSAAIYLAPSFTLTAPC